MKNVYDAAKIGCVVSKLVSDLQKISSDGLENMTVSGHICEYSDEWHTRGAFVVKVEAKVSATADVLPVAK